MIQTLVEKLSTLEVNRGFWSITTSVSSGKSGHVQPCPSGARNRYWLVQGNLSLRDSFHRLFSERLSFPTFGSFESIKLFLKSISDTTSACICFIFMLFYCSLATPARISYETLPVVAILGESAELQLSDPPLRDQIFWKQGGVTELCRELIKSEGTPFGQIYL